MSSNITSKVITTKAGEALIAQMQAENKVLVIDKFIFANVLNRPDFPQREDLLPTEYVVHESAVHEQGRMTENSVIYSTTLASNVGPFTFNWSGLYCSEHNTLVAINFPAAVDKTVDGPGVTGNTLVRSFVLEYKGIAETTNITVDPASWQYDAHKRMSKMDNDSAQAIIDQNGKDWFIDDGFIVTPQSTAYNIKAGAGYVSGHRITLDFDRIVQVPEKPAFIYVDAYREGNPTGEWVTKFNFVVSPDEKDDYTDAQGVQHFVSKIAQVMEDGSVGDLRPDKIVASKEWMKKKEYKQTQMVTGQYPYLEGSLNMLIGAELRNNSALLVTDYPKQGYDSFFIISSPPVAAVIKSINLNTLTITFADDSTSRLTTIESNAVLVSDIKKMNANVGAKVKVSGYFEPGDLKRHPGFIIKAGNATEVTGRVINLENGNHAVIDCDENSINVNWFGVNSSRSDDENAAQIQNHVDSLTSVGVYTLFFNDDINLGSITINRDDTYLITNRRVKLSSSKDWIFRPNCRNFKLTGFSGKNFNSHLIYVDENTEQVSNHDYEDIRINGADPVTRTVFLYSTASGGKGWRNISFNKVRGFTAKTASAAFINADHGNTNGLCAEVYVNHCRAHGYTELYASTGSGYATIAEIKSSFAIDCNGRGLSTYHTSGGLVLERTEVSKHAQSAYIWAGVVMQTKSKRPAVITNNKFNACTNQVLHHITGKPVGHGVIYEQLQKAVVGSNVYQENNGAGYVVGAGAISVRMFGETSAQNLWGAIVCSDAGGISSRIRDVTLESCNHWGNLRDSVLIGGRVERLTIDGGYHKDNCTSNSDWANTPTGMSAIHFDKDHTEVKEGGVQENNPQINQLRILSAELAKSVIGGTDVNSYPEHSVFIDSPDISCNVFVTADCLLNALKSEIRVVSKAGSRIFVRNNTKASGDNVDILSTSISGGPAVVVVDGNYDWNGNLVGVS